MLKLSNLKVSVKKEAILNGVNLEVNQGEVHAIMGRNGCGKSTLLSTIMGNEVYSIKDGKIELGNIEIQDMDANLRANLGLFMTFQTPYDFFEVRTVDILTYIWNKKQTEKRTADDFVESNKQLLEDLNITNEMLHREFNVGFSGGERKRLEVAQLLLTNPSIILLDEIDTGLDIDSIITIGNTLKEYQKKKNATVLIVTHLLTFLKYLSPDKVHVMDEGVIVKTGKKDLAERISQEGYSFLT